MNIVDDDDEHAGVSTWEKSSKRSWEEIEEEDGILKVSHEDEELENHRRRRAKASDVVNQANIRKGLIRWSSDSATSTLPLWAIHCLEAAALRESHFAFSLQIRCRHRRPLRTWDERE